jgi:amino-acid N-acetyltransferase
MDSFEVHAKPSLQAAVALLNANGLPWSDLTESHLEHFRFSGATDALTGLVGLEIHGCDALLRSLAVVPGAQYAGLGSRLLREAERYAFEKGVHSLYLLTTTAQGFFLHRGYRAASREACPAGIRSTTEFATLCPASSAFLMKVLN